MVVHHSEPHRKVHRRSTTLPTGRRYLTARSAADDDRIAHVRCDGCNAAPPIAPIRSRYRAPSFVEHDWMCSHCGNEWTTMTQVLL